MLSNYSEAAYRQASANGATHIGLLIIVYDALARDLRAAGDSVRRGNISERCHHSNHALLLVGHLEIWVDSLDDALLATSLKEFYSFLRTRILAGQQETSPIVFETLATLVAETRAVWQLKEQKLTEEKSHQDARSPRPVAQDSLDHPRQVSTWSA